MAQVGTTERVNTNDRGVRLLGPGIVAKILGRTRTTVRRWEKEGKLRGIIDPMTGRHRYDPKDVDRLLADLRRIRKPLPELNEGELAAEVYRRFDAREDSRQIVKALLVTPQYVAELWEHYVEPDHERKRRKKKQAEDAERDAESIRELERTMSKFGRRVRRSAPEELPDLEMG